MTPNPQKTILSYKQKLMVKALINQVLEIEQALMTIGREIAKQFHSKSKNQNTLKYFESFV